MTLSISGLGFHETEVEDIPAASKAPVQSPTSCNTHTRSIQKCSGTTANRRDHQSAAWLKIHLHPRPDRSPRSATSTGGAACLNRGHGRTRRGEDVFRTFYRNRTGPEQARVNAIGDELREIMDAVPQQE